MIEAALQGEVEDYLARFRGDRDAGAIPWWSAVGRRGRAA